MEMNATASFALPEDGGLLVGRIWRPDLGGPSVVAVRDGTVFDITRAAPTVSDLCNSTEAMKLARDAEGERLMPVDELLAGTPRHARKPMQPWLIAPVDLQAIKAAGVTFAISMLERVIEERARGAPDQAASLRAEITGMIGDDLSRLKPGSPQAMALKDLLIRKGMWSQYLEVGIGPDAEVFTKAPPMAAVGHLAEVGIHPMSTWNNPEPEIVVVVSAHGEIVGAALGNDVNLRDVEGRSALLLGKAKDNNASASIGPFVRLFDDSFTLDHVRRATVGLTVEGEDGFRLEGKSDMGKISRDPAG
jgi:fumarylacetoacetate (FAA) hydrolase family protein